MKISTQHLFKPSLVGLEKPTDAQALLREAGLLALQKQAGYIPPVTDKPLRETIESYWLKSSYRKLSHPVRFVGRVVMQWIFDVVGDLNFNEPNATAFADEHIYRMIEADKPR